MSKSAQVPGGTVTSIQGRATVIPSGHGAAHVLKVGDSVQAGDAVLTSAGTNLVVTDEQGNPWAPRDLILALAEANAAPVAKPGKSLHAKIKAAVAHHEDAPADKDADQTIQALNQGDADAAPAAGGGGGGAGSMTPGLRVDRVIEVLSAQEFSIGNTERAAATTTDIAAAVMDSAVADAVAKLSATDDTFTTNKGVVVGLPVLNNDGIDVATAPQVTAINGQTILPGGQVVVDHGVVQMSSTGALTFAPNDGYVGNQTFTYTVANSTGQTADAAVTVTVVTPPAVPVANPDLLVMQENKVATVFVTANDDAGSQGPIQITQINGQVVVAGDSVTVSHGTITLNSDGSLTITPDAHYSGDISFAYTVADQAGQTANSTVNVQVTPVNDAPVIGSATDPTFNPSTGNYAVTTDEDKPVSGKVTATDADGDTLTFAKGLDPEHGSVTVHADGTWTYTPSKDYNGSDSFTVTVSDGHVTTTSTINVGITPVNDAPVIGSATDPTFNPSTGNYTVTTDEDKPVSGKVTATDADGDALTFAKGLDPEHGSVTVHADGTWTYTPAKDYNGPDSFTVTVSDGHDTTTTTINVGVTPFNDAPVIGSATDPTFNPSTGYYAVTTDEDKPVSGKVTATDVDGDALTFAKGLDPEHGSVTVHADGTWTYTPAQDYNGSDSFTVTVSDGHVTTTSTINVGITPVNDAPVIGSATDPTFNPSTGNYTVTTDEDKPVSGKVTATDADGDALTFAKGLDPEHGSVTVHADGTWTYTPAKDYNGPDSFTVTVSDGHDTTTSTINVGITPVNDAPVIGSATDPTFNPSTGNYAVTTDEDKPVSGKVTATDVDGDALTFAKGLAPEHGSVTVHADGTWTYTPAQDYNGSDSFTVTVSDGHVTTTSTINVGITPVNDAPVIGSATDPTFNPSTGNYAVTTDEDKPVSGKVTATDADGDALTFAKGLAPEHGSVTVHADGTWTYTPAKDYNGPDSFTVTVSDGHVTTTSTINVGITPVNDAPSLGANGTYNVSTPEDQPVSGQVVASDVDGDSLTYAKGTDPTHGSVTVNTNGTWTYTPSKDYNGADSFTVTVSDGHGGTTTSTINVGVTPANDAPTAATNYNVSTPEDQPVSGQVVASDVDGDTLTYTKGADPAHGSVTVNADGTWTYTPAKDYNGSDSFTVTVSDGQGGTTTSTINVGVTAVNDAPTTTANYNVSTPEDQPVSGQVVASDVDGDTLTYAKGTDPAHGSVTVNADGTWTYTPAKDYNGADSFSVTVSDGQGGTTTSTVNVGVTPVNDAPTAAANYNVSTPEDQPVSGQVVASDVDGDTLTYAKGTDPAHGSVTVNADGTWTYTPAKDYNGADSFSVTVSDGHGGTTTSTVNVGVTPVNDAPTAAANYNVSTPEDQPISGQVVASDVDGDTLTYAKGTDPAHGSVTVNADGTWTYTPAKDYNGADSFTVTVSDGQGGTTTSTINVGVTPVNDAPTAAANYNVSTPEDQPVSGQVVASDVDGDTLTYAKGTDPAHGSVTVNADGTWTYTPAKDYNGSDSFTVTVSDGQGGTTTSTVNVGVTAVNDAPTTTANYNVSTPEDQPVSGQVVASDVDGDTLTYAKGTDPAHGSVTVNADGTWTYTPSKDYNGADSFTVTVSDGQGGTTTSTINVGVTPVNDAPTAAANYNVSTPEDQSVSGQVVASDVDGDTLTYAKGTDPAHGSVTVNTDGTWTYTPSKDYNGSDSFTVTVSDGQGGTTTSTVNVGVTPVNDAPKFGDNSDPTFNYATGNYSVNTEEDKPVSGQVKATDADGDTLIFAKGTDPAHGSVTVNADGTWTYTPSKDYNGADSFTVTVSDGQGGTTTSTINVGVTPVNDAPTAAANYNVSTPEDQPVSGQVVASDVDGDTLTYAKGTDPAHGSVTVNADGTWTYTPAKDYNGSDSFTVTVSDGQGGTTTSTVNVGVTAVNDAPTTTANYNVSTPEDQPISGQVVASDVDGDTLTYAKGTDPAHGSVTVNADGTWTYTPSKDYNGSDSFTVTVSDGQGGTTTSTVNVGVTPVNDAPTTTANYNVSTPEDQPVSGQVVASDVDGDTLTYAKGTDPAHGSVTVNADGTWTYTPSKDYNGSDSFTVTVSDGQGGTTTSTINVGVTPVNDAPTTTANYNVSTPEDQPVSGQVVASDVDGDTLTYAKGTDPAHGSVTVNADGTWTYTPSKDYNGSDSFTVTVSDGQGGTTTSTVNVGVTPVNDAPKFGDNSDPTFSYATGNYSVNTEEDKPVSGQVKATDADGDILTFAKGTDPAHGSVTVNADGTWTYTPSKDYNGSDSFTVTVSDGQGGTTTSTINVGVTPVNDAPTTTANYNVSTPEDQPVSGQVVASDVDGDTLTYAKGADPAHGSVTVNADGTWTYTPAKDYNGADSFTVTVSDGHGGTTTSTINVGVTPVNDAPTSAASYSVTTLEDQPVSGQVVASDVDGDTLTYAKGTDPAHGSVTVNADGTWTYTPAKDYNGADSFSVTVSDGHGGTTTSTINVGVTPVNDAPKFGDNSDPTFNYATGNYSVSTAEDTPVSGKLAGTDVDGDTLTFAKGTDPAHGSVTVNANGNWTYTPAKDYNGADSFTVTVSDGHGGTATSTVNVGITPVNDPAIISTGSGSVTEDANVTAGKLLANGTLTVSDVDTGESAFQVQGGTTGTYGTFTLASNGAWTYSAVNSQTAIQALGAGQTATDTFTVKSIDGTTSTVTVTLNGANDAPVLTLDANSSSGASAGNFNTRFTENGAAVSIADADISITDVDSANLTGATIKLTNAQNGDILTAGALPSGITASAYNASTGVLTLSGSASAASYQAAIKAIAFSNAGDYPSAVDRTVTVTVTDGTTASTGSTSTISIALQNDAPAPTLTVTPVGYWTFNDAVGSTSTYNRSNASQTGTLADDSSTGGSGLPVFDSAAQRNAASGNYINFTDTGDRVNIATSISQPLMGTATMTFWLKTSMVGSSSGNGNSWDLASIIGSEQNGGGNDIQWGSISSTGKIGFGLGNVAGVYSTTSINDNTWHNVAITRSSTTGLVQVFVDGRLEATGSPSDSAFDATLNRLTSIGVTNQFSNNPSGSDMSDSRYYNGALDDLHIYDRVLTADQISAIRTVENGYQNHAIANDGSSALKLAVTAANFTSLSVTGLEAGMTITDGTHSATSSANDTAIDLTGWTLGSLQVTNAGTHSATLAFTATDNVGGDTHTTTQYLNVVTGSTILTGSASNDMLVASGSESAFIAGGAGQDNINGGSGNDRLLGQAGDDNLTGNAGHDVLIGGAGNDLLTGGAGNDVFRWEFGDAGAKGSPAVDVISDFSSSAGNKDVLDLRDLLQGDNHVGTNTGNLSNFIHFEYNGADTVIHLSSTGGFNTGYSAGNEDQTIVLRSVDLTVGGTLTTDHQIIKDLLTKGQLNVD